MSAGVGVKEQEELHDLISIEVYLLVVIMLCVGHKRFLTTRGRVWGYMSIVFDKFYDVFLRSMEEDIKRQTKKAEI